MHEFSICEQLLRIVLEEWERLTPRPRRLAAVRIAVGRLQQIVPETMQSAFETLARGTPAEGARLELRHVPVRVRCSECGAEREVIPPDFACPACGSVRVTIVAGRDLSIESLEVEDA